MTHTVYKKLKALSHTVDGKETGIFMSYNSKNKVYKVHFLNSSQEEYFGEWKLAKEFYLAHCKNYTKFQTPKVNWEEIQRLENAQVRNDLHLARGRSGQH